MSEIEQVSEPDKQIPNGTNDIDGVEITQQPQGHLLVSEDAQPLVNGTVASASSAQSTPVAAPPIKRFSSADVSKKFLQKTSSALNSNNVLSTANSSSSSPAPSKAAATTAASKPGSNTSTSRLVTTKLTQTPSSSTTKWSKDTSMRPFKPSTPGSDGPIVKPGQSSTKVSASKERAAIDGSGKAVWGSVITSAKANSRVQNDFPTAAELKDRAEQAAAASAAQRRALDAFRGIHLDPKAQHWDEMTEEDGDFLSGVIEFGDGKQYNVAPAQETEPVNDDNPSEDRLGNDFDRSWPASRENGVQPPQSSTSPSVSPLATTNPHGDRVLFNDRHNRMEPLPPRQASTTPTLLHAHPSPQSLRSGTVRRESDGRGFREPSTWNPPFQRGTYATSESSEKQGDTRLRRPSASERDKSTPYASGGLGPHLRDRSPDGSGRFPGRNIQKTARRDSQASSGIVPARSTRALSRESSDRGSAVRQLPPHLGGSMGPTPAAHAPPLLASTAPSSIPSRTSWPGSPTDARSPVQVPQTPSMVHSEKTESGVRSEHNVVPLTSLVVSQQAVAAALIEDEATFKLSMAVAAERARKRRLEEEEQRKIESERAKKKKLADLEAKIQAEKEAKEAEERAKREREEAERLSRLEAEKQVKEKERALQSARTPPPSRPPMASDNVDSWRGSAPARPSVATQIHPSGRRLTNGSSDSRWSPTVTLKQKPFDRPQTPPTLKAGPVDLSGKPANSAIIAEVAALQSKTVDDSVQVLHFSDLRQLAEGYGQALSASTVAVNEPNPSASTRPILKLKSPVETRSSRPHESGSTLAVPHSPVGGSFDDSRGFKPPRHAKSPAPPALDFVPRASQEHRQPNAPTSAGLSPSWSPRVQDPNQPGYRQAPISVLDDTLSRFKMAIMHSNPVHAGMSSDDIMQGLGRGGVESDRGTQNPGSRLTASSHPSPHGLNKPTGEPTWAQTQSMEPKEEDELPSVLIPTLSLKREPVAPKKIHGMKVPQAWRWDHLTFDPPVHTMNRRTLSVMDALAQGPTGGTVHLRIKVPGASARNVPYLDSSSQTPKALSRPRREDLRVNATSLPSPLPGGLASAPKTAPSQWPSKTRGSEEAVWRRAVPVTASLDQPPASATPERSPAIKSAAGTNHNRTFSNSISPIGTPPQTMSTWGRSPLSLTVTEDLPDDPSLKAAWNKGSSASEAQITKNSLRDIADDPPPQIPSSISDLKSEDGDAAKSNEKASTPPTIRPKYNPHRAFQQVSSQFPASQTAPESSLASISPSLYPTPRSNALALSTNRTPRQTSPSSLPPPAAPMNQSHLGYTVPYLPPMHPVGSPYTQPAMARQYSPGPTPVMAPPTPGMVHRNVAQGMPMQQPLSNQPMWGQQPPAAASPPVPMGFVRQMHPSMPPAGPYPATMVQQAPQSLQLYPHPPAGMMHHPPSPAVSPMMAPGMNKPFSTPSRTNSLSSGLPTTPSPALPVSMPVTFQMPPYVMPSHMHPPPVQSPQGIMPHARPPPQGRGVPMHPSQYLPAPNNFPRQGWMP